EPLFWPPGLPSYNGSCAAGIGSRKWRTAWQALRQGDPWAGTWDDLEGARQEANTQARPKGVSGAAPEEAGAPRPVLRGDGREGSRERVGRGREAARREPGWPEEEALSEAEQRGVDRVAIRRALVAHGYLRFTRRRMPLPIRRRKPAEATRHGAAR